MSHRIHGLVNSHISGLEFSAATQAEERRAISMKYHVTGGFGAFRDIVLQRR